MKPRPGSGDRRAPRSAGERSKSPGGRGRPERPAPVVPAKPSDEPLRINRYIARAGVCSRREADELVAKGQVRLNGEVVTTPGFRVGPKDRVEVNGRLISPRTFLYLLLNKPTDTITTTDDERGRRTVLDLVDLDAETMAGVFPVGRLDRDTTGALLLTNDGELAHRLMHPSYVVEKIYRVRSMDPVKPEELDRLVEGVELEDGRAAADRVTYYAPPDLREVGISVHEGRNRLVRRMFEALGHRVDQLDRIRYAGLTTRGIRRGHWRRLDSDEVARLYRLVHLKT